MQVNQGRIVYIFMDEAGNFDFNPSGTQYFIITSITKERPFEAYRELTELKYDLVEIGTNIDYFHASEYLQAVRKQVFNVIQNRLSGVRIDSLIIEKRNFYGPNSNKPREEALILIASSSLWILCQSLAKRFAGFALLYL